MGCEEINVGAAVEAEDVNRPRLGQLPLVAVELPPGEGVCYHVLFPCEMSYTEADVQAVAQQETPCRFE